MCLVEHQALVRRQHRGLVPIVGRLTHGEIGGEQMVVHDHHVGLRGLAAGTEQEATVEMHALHPRAEIRLGGHFVPHFGTRWRREIAQRAVGGAPGPFADGSQLVELALFEQRLLARRR